MSNHVLVYADMYGDGKIIFLELYLRLMLPLGILLLMLVIMVFDFCCTFMAELSGYPDHLFYEDFWNATTMTEFLGKMSRIIPTFFKVHVLHELVVKHGVKLAYAKAISFAFSAALLELLMVPV